MMNWMNPLNRSLAKIAAGVVLVWLTMVSAAQAELNVARFEGYWDPDGKRTDAINWITLAARGQAQRKFAVTYIEGESSEGGAGGLWEPQFLPVTNVEGRKHDVATFFAATAQQKVTIDAMMTDGGEDLILTSVVVMSGTGKKKSPAAP